jgi:hypothetical protein
MTSKSPVKIMHVGQIAIAGPTELDLKITARIDLDFAALQRKFLKEDFDPIEMDNIQMLVPILTQKLDISPFVVKYVRPVSVSKTDIVVEIDSHLTANNDLGDRQAILDEYEKVLRNKLTGLIT